MRLFILTLVFIIFNSISSETLNINSDSLNLTCSRKYNTIFYLGASTLVPGLGQFLSGHPVRGPIVFSLEAVLVSTGANDGFYLTGKWQERIDNVNARLHQSFSVRDYSFLGGYISRDSLFLVDSLEDYKGKLLYSRAIRDRTLAWAAGFHLFNVLDCYDYLKPEQKDFATKSPRGAFVRSLLVPGWGQLYNHAYSKLGLYWMCVAGFSANMVGWNRTSDYYEGLESKYHALFRSSAQALTYAQGVITEMDGALANINASLQDTALSAMQRDSLLDEKNRCIEKRSSATAEKTERNRDRTFFSDREYRYAEEKKSYLSKRNQNIWYLAALYLYGAFDAYVDASVDG